MDLYILRHGDAGPNASSAKDDDARELTEQGRHTVSYMIAQAKRAGLVAPSIILSSPLPRAKQTAAIAQVVWGCSCDTTHTNTLLKGDIPAMMSEIASLYPLHHAVLLTGHEPSLSAFASAVLAATDRSFIELDKAGMIHISIYQPDPVRMRGFLRMYMAPHHLAQTTAD